MRWWLRAGVDPMALAPGLERVLAQLDTAADQRAGRRKRLFRVALENDQAPDHLLKRSGYAFARGWLRRADGSKARRELEIAQRLAARGVPVVVPLAAGERRRFGRVSECFLLVPLIADAQDLRQLWLDPGLAPRTLRRLMVSLGRVVQRAHAAGLHQHDLAPNNVLVCDAEAGDLRLVDFERARLARRAGSRARSQMLAKLARSAAGLPATQRLRFLRAYANDDRAARVWWARVRRAAAALARRDDLRWRRSATRAGRGFARIEGRVWRGFARRGVDPVAGLRASAPGPAPGVRGTRVEVAAGVWRVVYRRQSTRGARRLWARANTLAARGLAPVPLACISDRERTLLVLEAAPGMRPLGPIASEPGERRALARLLVELAALGDLDASLAGGMFALLPDRRGGVRAQLVAPHAVRFGGRPGDARSRAAADGLLARLAAPDDPGV